MGVVSRIWGWIAELIKANDKLERMGGTLREHKRQIEALSERVLRLEIALQYATINDGGGRRQTQRRNLPPPSG